MNDDLNKGDLDDITSGHSDGFDFIDITENEPVVSTNTNKPVSTAKKRLSKSDIVRYVVLAIAAVVFIYSAVNIVKIIANYKKGDKEYANVEEQVFNNITTSESKPNVLVNDEVYSEIVEENKSDEYEFLAYDHAALKAISENAQGYLDMPALDLTVPIAQCDDNDYYLDHAITGAYHSYGCPFIDYKIKDGLAAPNPVIYGHSMKNGAMFGELDRYLKKDFFETGNNRYFYVYCEEGVYIYEIYSVYVTDAYDAQTYVYNYATIDDYEAYIKRSKEKSRYNTGVEVDATDNIITLSTCYDEEIARLIVHAKRLK